MFSSFRLLKAVLRLTAGMAFGLLIATLSGHGFMPGG
jgi:hypothetical protein